MHLLIPFAHVDAPEWAVLMRSLNLPHLTQLLRQLKPLKWDRAEEDTFSAPHERALAERLGWRLPDGCLPWSALGLKERGGEPGDAAWARVTPCHWRLGADHVAMLDPAALALTDEESRALHAAALPYFEQDGLALHYRTPLDWQASGSLFENLPCASLDRVIGRALAPFMPAGPQAGLLRRLQSEMQMLFYNHAVNEAREAQGRLTVNALWISSSGVLPRDTDLTALTSITRPTALRDAARAADWQAYLQAWRALDAEECAALLNALQSGQPAQLTLCGERHACTLGAGPASWFGKIAAAVRCPADPVAFLETL